MANIDRVSLLDFDEEDYDTVLAADITFTGTIKFDKPFMIKGAVEGKIQSTSDLTIDEDAIVHADIKADRVVVKGEVVGNISATGIVHVLSCGKLTGDVVAPDVVLENGCFFKGICTMTKLR